MTYNIKTTRIFFKNTNNSISMCVPTGEICVEDVAKKDLPEGTPYWIVDFETEEKLQELLGSKMQFFNCLELDDDIVGEHHGISLGHDKWCELNRTVEEN